MFSGLFKQKKTETYNDKIARLKEALEEADVVLVGAGAGLSTSAGFVYDGERFQKYFGDFKEKYGFQDMYSGGFYPYDTLEEHWAYWSRYIWINRYADAPKPVYDELFELVKAGFDKKRLFYTQGDYGLFQCSEPCCQKTWDNENLVRQMVEQQKDMRIPSELVPHCPNCGKPMSMNLRADDTFVQDEGWYAASERYSEFVRRHQGMKTLYLELGVGYNTPGIIKYPFWQAAYRNPEATYVCINYGDAAAPKEIAERSICIDGDIGEVLEKIR